jgi:hypothetical protein
VFYFANLVGESGDAGASFARVNALDLAAVKRSYNANSTITGTVDFNRDGRVNALDLAAARANPSAGLSAVTPSAAPALALAAGPAWDESDRDLLA